jgi:L-arabinonolactonase
MQPTLIDVIPVENELGEGVIWDVESGAVWWLDINSNKLYYYQLATKHLESWTTPERIGCFAFVEGQEYIIAAFESGLAYYNPMTGWLKWLHSIEPHLPDNRLNDGRTDRQGRFWAGTMVESSLDDSSDRGALYCLDHQHECILKIPGLTISNGLCWSPDSRYMYHTDTPTRHINRYRFDPDTTEISEPELFVETDPGCFPDGSVVDAEGFLWNAQWGGSQVVRYSPEGKIDLVLPVPAAQVTCAAIGGPDLNLLFVSTARAELSDEELQKTPDAGGLFIYEIATKGLLESPYKPD